ncbi:MAG: GNAT family N-acetyltransferase [Deltaproteobacteria bacterium]|jgi:[ribosomal protein S5]-alanine N-acetyltransferase|nr:GNAT family N-acetyltransferase [Deltaproteobacteria bacterium]
MHRKLYLETERLHLYRPIDEDYEFLSQNLRDPRMTAHLGGNMPEAQIKNMVMRTRKQWNDHGFGTCAIFLKEKMQQIGNAGAKFWPPDTKDAVDIGFGITPEYQGQGFAFEAALAIAADCFNHHQFPALTCHTSIHNVAALKLIKKLGFIQIKVVDVVADGATYKDVAFFELPRGNFLKMHGPK